MDGIRLVRHTDGFDWTIIRLGVSDTIYTDPLERVLLKEDGPPGRGCFYDSEGAGYRVIAIPSSQKYRDSQFYKLNGELVIKRSRELRRFLDDTFEHARQ